jgi:GNAT superfamily N-acetyltransferase
MLILNIRPLESKDRGAWLPLWQGYQAFYTATISDENTALTWQRFHDPAVPMFALGAFAKNAEDAKDETLLGIAHYVLHYSCWTPSMYCYLQDLFVHERARGQGVGRQLIEALYGIAPQHGADRVYWLTHETNGNAMHLYDKIATKTGFLQYRKMLNAP